MAVSVFSKHFPLLTFYYTIIVTSHDVLLYEFSNNTTCIVTCELFNCLCLWLRLQLVLLIITKEVTWQEQQKSVVLRQ